MKGRFDRSWEGKSVHIEWADEADWNRFQVLRVWPNRRVMRIVGEPQYGVKHNQDEFAVLFEDINSMVEVKMP